MSLINKMLQDLEQRHAEEAGGGLPHAVRATPAPQRGRSWRMALFVLLTILLCALLAWLWSRAAAEKRPLVTVASTYAAAPPPAVVVAPPAPSLTLKVDGDLDMKAIAEAASQPAPESVQPAPAPFVLTVPEGAASNSGRQAGSAGTEMDKTARADASPAKPRETSVRRAARPVQPQELAPSKTATVGEQPLTLNKQVRELTAQQKAENDYRSAITLIQQGRAQEAITLLERVLQADAAHAGARQTLIALMLNAKRRDEAMRLAQQGLDLDVRQPNFAMILARLQLDKGDQKAAIATLQRSLQAANGNAEYQAFLAALLQREGRNAEAIDLYEAALDKAPQSGVWWMGLGISLQADQRLPQARTAFIHARDTRSLSPDLQAFVEQKIRQLAH